MKRRLTIVLIVALAVFAAAGTVFAAEKSETDLAIEQLMQEIQGKEGQQAKPGTEKESAAPIGIQPTPTASKEKQELAETAPVSVPAGRPKAPSKMTSGAAETDQSLLVDVEWLKKNIANVILVDTRPAEAYVANHLPGAVNASWTYFANTGVATGTKTYGTVWQEATMAKRIGALGINGSKTVIVYDDGAGWGQAGYTVAVMRMSGIKNAKILTGGITAWKKEGGKLSTAKHANKAVAFNIKAYDPTYIVNTKWVDDNIGKPGFKLIDVRIKQEFEGKIRPFGEKRAGHLPMAINISMGEFITSDFKWKSADEIKAVLTASGITPENEVVVYDTAGIRAANVLMMLRYAGYTNSRFYDESFQAWAGDASLEIEK